MVLVSRTPTVSIILVFPIITWQHLFQNDFVDCKCVRLRKSDCKFTTTCWCHVMAPSQVSLFSCMFWCTGTCACISNLNCAHKGDTFPPRTTSLLERSSDLQEAYTKICSYSANCFNNGMVLPWHDTMPSFMILKPSFSMFSTEPRCPDVWILFSFFAWDLLPPSIYIGPNVFFKTAFDYWQD